LCVSADAHIDLSIEEILDLAPKSGPHSAPKMEVEKVKAHCAPSLFPPPFWDQKTAPVLGPAFFDQGPYCEPGDQISAGSFVRCSDQCTCSNQCVCVAETHKCCERLRHDCKVNPASPRPTNASKASKCHQTIPRQPETHTCFAKLITH
jgi:hypothetical protein